MAPIDTRGFHANRVSDAEGSDWLRVHIYKNDLGSTWMDDLRSQV